MTGRRFLRCSFVGLAAATFSVASATWLATASGLATSKALAVNGASAPSATVSNRSVELTWTASTLSDGSPVTGYIVKRYDSSGVEQTISSGTCASTVAGTSCSETGVPSGSWQYSVTPAHNGWRGPESPTASATVSSPVLSLSTSLVKSPSTVSGTISNFIAGETIRFYLDSSSGTELAGTVAGSATPATVPAGGSASVTVELPAGVSEGSHSIVAVSSPSDDRASAGITVDNTRPPSPSIDSAPVHPTNSTSANFAFSDTEANVTFKCQLDGTGYSTCTSPKSYTGLTQGPHTFSVKAVDLAGNESDPTSYTWTVDSAKPLPPTITDSPSSPTTSTSASFSFTHAEPGVTFECQFDGGGFTTCTSPKVYSGLSNGSHKFDVKARDAAGNESDPTSYSWTIDTSLPSTTITFPVPGGTYGAGNYAPGCGTTAGDMCGTASASGGATVSSVQISVQRASTGLYWNGALSGFNSATPVWFTATGMTSWSYAFGVPDFPSDGDYTLRARATDSNGKVGPVATSTFAVDKTAPTAQDVQTANGGATVGKAEQGDTITFTYSERMDPSSLLAGWNGASTNVVVRLLQGAAGGTDKLQVWNASNTTQVKLTANLDLGRTDYTATAGGLTFGLSGTPSTMVMSGSSVIVTFGTPSNVAATTAAGSGTMIWPPMASATDLAANECSQTDANELGSPDPEF